MSLSRLGRVASLAGAVAKDTQAGIVGGARGGKRVTRLKSRSARLVKGRGACK